jgi:hypothetical protein
MASMKSPDRPLVVGRSKSARHVDFSLGYRMMIVGSRTMPGETNGLMVG